VLREYAEMIEESEIHRSGPMKGKCEPRSRRRSPSTARSPRRWIADAGLQSPSACPTTTSP
jgi:hypothetical protein